MAGIMSEGPWPPCMTCLTEAPPCCAFFQHYAHTLCHRRADVNRGELWRSRAAGSETRAWRAVGRSKALHGPTARDCQRVPMLWVPGTDGCLMDYSLQRIPVSPHITSPPPRFLIPSVPDPCMALGAIWGLVVAADAGWAAVQSGTPGSTITGEDQYNTHTLSMTWHHQLSVSTVNPSLLHALSSPRDTHDALEKPQPGGGHPITAASPSSRHGRGGLLRDLGRINRQFPPSASGSSGPTS